MDGADLKRALRHPVNFKPVVFCTISLMAIGIVLLVFGIVALLVDHIELGPPHFDEHYERYQNSSMPHIIGPMFVVCGIFLIAGNICTLAYATYSRYAPNVMCPC